MYLDFYLGLEGGQCAERMTVVLVFVEAAKVDCTVFTVFYCVHCPSLCLLCFIVFVQQPKLTAALCSLCCSTLISCVCPCVHEQRRRSEYFSGEG